MLPMQTYSLLELSPKPELDGRNRTSKKDLLCSVISKFQKGNMPWNNGYQKGVNSCFASSVYKILIGIGRNRVYPKLLKMTPLVWFGLNFSTTLEIWS